MIFRKNSSGFTFIEVLVAVAVFCIGIVAVIYMFPFGAKIEMTSQKETVALFLAQEKLEETMSGSYLDAGMSLGTTTEDYGTISGFSVFKRVKEISYYDPQTSSVTSSDLGTKKLDITVYWGYGAKSIKLSSLISQK